MCVCVCVCVCNNLFYLGLKMMYTPSIPSYTHTHFFYEITQQAFSPSPTEEEEEEEPVLD